MIAITPRGPLRGRVTLPGSKSISNRALILAAETFCQACPAEERLKLHDRIDRPLTHIGQ